MLKDYKYGEDYRPYCHFEIEMMYHKRICGLPISFLLLDLRKTDTYCHNSSDYLAYCFGHGNRVSGEIDTIAGNDKSHSWFELEDWVYDPTEGLVWRKDIYYKRLKPQNITVHSLEETNSRLERYTKYQKNLPEMYIAWIEDIKELPEKTLYRKFLVDHCERLIKEKDLANCEINPEYVEEFKRQLKELYQHIKDFIAESKKEEQEKKKQKNGVE